MKALSIYTTCKNKAEAKKISKVLLYKKLVACANIFPVDSLYLWKKKLTYDKEVAIIFKTLKKNSKKVMLEIKKLHSYKTPAMSIEEIEVDKETFSWLNNELK